MGSEKISKEIAKQYFKLNSNEDLILLKVKNLKTQK